VSSIEDDGILVMYTKPSIGSTPEANRIAPDRASSEWDKKLRVS